VKDSTSVSLAQEYQKAGWKKVYYLKGITLRGAWHDWTDAKYPTSPK
jgi:hypothetical protein